MARGETSVKTFNTIKKDVQEKIFSDENEGKSIFSEFISAYGLFHTNYFKNFKNLDAEFDKMNSFTKMPEMSYLKQMNAIQEKRIALLSDGTKFFEEISSEINSKPFKRWDVKVIDKFVSNYKTSIDYEMYKLLRPICKDIYLLKLCINDIAYLKCTYPDWTFMAQKGFGATTDVGNPLYNYNLICYKQIFEQSDSNISFSIQLREKKDTLAWKLDQKKIDNIDIKLDFSKIIFKDYSDNFIFSSWMIDSKKVDKSKNNKNLYSKELANANNTLSLLFLTKSLDFENTTLSQLFKKYKLEIKNCTYDNNSNEYNYNFIENNQAFSTFYENKIFDIDQTDKEKIQLLSSIVPQESPFFYLEYDAESYRNLIKKFDPKWFDVYQIKKNIILSSAILLSLKNDLELNNLNSTPLQEWFNEKMEANQLKAYFQNDYMKKFGKNDSEIWSADNIYLESLLKKLSLVKYLIKDNFISFKSSYSIITTVDEFDKYIESSTKSNIIIDFDAIANNHIEEINYSEIHAKYKRGKRSPSDLNSLGWRCLINNQLESAEKYFNQGLKRAKDKPLITLNLAHVMLFKGDYKKATKLYKKYPMDQIIPELNLDVKSSIKMGFDEFIKIGKDPQIFDGIRKDLGL